MVNSINMPVSRERMEKYQNRQIRQIEHAAKQWEAREAKSKNNSMRREWMERQTNANYRNEYDRIRGELSHQYIIGYTSYVNGGDEYRRIRVVTPRKKYKVRTRQGY
jgi:hypothetical protein